MTDLTKDVDELKDWSLDYTEELGSDTIASSTWTVPVGITSPSNNFATPNTTIWLSGGTAGTSYVLLNTVTTAAGRTYQRSITIAVVDAVAAALAPLTLVATVGATNANTYCTKAQASAVGGYFATRLFCTDWTGASAEDRNKALVWATQLLDAHVDWAGVRTTEDQALAWPRYEVSDQDGYAIGYDSIPVAIRNATAEFALSLLGSDRTADPATLGLERVQVGDIAIQIAASDRDKTGTIPDQVRRMIARFGAVAGTRGIGTAKLIRA